jgi:6-phosphogluconate dehydrogenase
MDVGMIGLGRMGANMARRLMQGGHRVVAWDVSANAVTAVVAEGATGAGSLEGLCGQLTPPRVVWMMVPAGDPVERTIEALTPHLDRGDIVVDGGNSNYHDSTRRAAALRTRGVEYVDVGVSGGIWGLREGFCLMAGGSDAAYGRIEPLLKALAQPGGYAHVGPSGAGHFVKMVHNGIEYGLMAAYGEGFELLAGAPFRLDLRAISGLWQHGSVVRSWLLELCERAFERDPRLESVRGYVEDSGEGRWAVDEAIAQNVPLPIITLSLMQRFASRQDASFGAKLQAALRREFGGHAVQDERLP